MRALNNATAPLESLSDSHHFPNLWHWQTDAAAEFTKASRPDLAEKEQQEAAILNAFLPPLLPVADIDRVLRALVAAPPLSDALAKSGPPQKVLGQVFKAFYGQIDKSSVDPDVVRQRAQALLDGTKA